MWRWLIWIAFVIAWTLALELPVPETEDLPGGRIVMTYKYLIAKSIHVSIYAFFTVLTAWLPVTARYRWILMFCLMLHACGTEFFQELLADYCNRGGSLRDIAFDVAGIVIGSALSWKWWTRD